MGGQGGLFYLTRRGAPPISRNQLERVGVGGGDKGGWETDTESVEEGAEGAWWEIEQSTSVCISWLPSFPYLYGNMETTLGPPIKYISI